MAICWLLRDPRRRCRLLHWWLVPDTQSDVADRSTKMVYCRPVLPPSSLTTLTSFTWATSTKFFFSVKVGESEINKGGQPRTCRLFLVARTSKSASSAYYVNFLVPFFLFFSSLLISSFNSIGATNGDHFCNKKAWPLGLFFSCINLQIVFLIVINSDFFLLRRARK